MSHSHPTVTSTVADAITHHYSGFHSHVLALGTTGAEPGQVQSLIGDDDAYKWGAGSFGTAGTMTYTFDVNAFFASNGFDDEYDISNYRAFTTNMRAAVESVMDFWSNLADITFTETSAASADATFWTEDLLPQGVAGYALPVYDGSGSLEFAGVSVDRGLNDFTPGSYGWFTILHEVGHAIGLKHPGDYNATGGGGQTPFLEDFDLPDTWDFTVMSYNEGNITSVDTTPHTPMFYDVEAIQHVYGENGSHNAGKTYYDMTLDVAEFFSPRSPHIYTRWDSGGTDTLDARDYTVGGVRLDLRENVDAYSQVGYSYSWNARGSFIEQAFGGQKDDTIHGNVFGNRLWGQAGDDRIYGHRGNDAIRGDAGNDYLFGMDGNDHLRGGSGNDGYWGGDGDDRFIFDANGGKDTIVDFEIGSDELAYAGGSVTEAYALAQASQVGDHVYFEMYNTTIVIKDTLLSEFTGEEFIV